MKRFWLPLGLFAMVVIGSYDMLRGAAAPLMQMDWRLGYEQLGEVFSVGSLGYLAGTLTAGQAVSRLGIRRLVVLGAAVVALGTATVLMARGFLSAAIGFAVVGFGTGGLEIGTNAVIPAITASGAGQARYFNWLHGFYGIGACGLPLAAGWYLQTSHAWRGVYGVLAVAVAVIFALAAWRRQEAGADASNRWGTAGTASADPAPVPWRSGVLWGLMAAIGVYVMAEVGLGTWLTTYLKEARGLPLGLASICLSGFFLTFTAGRLAAPALLNRVEPRRLILAALAVALTLLGSSLLFPTGTMDGLVVAGVMASGAGFSVLFPTLTALASHRFAAQADRVIGLMFTAGAIGSMAVNTLIGAVSSAWGIRMGFGLIWGFLWITLGMVMVLPGEHGQKSGRRDEDLSGYPGQSGPAETRRDACEDAAQL
ncbi:sugar MFS transporter [Alicyclobacillus sp.]|uniref:MFS transporter n=1 Tax=Alicyclobacillus sp. TaxID=61169 RepID=UPI0025B7AAF0|nr:MFS transporter [Alicyclobacillus sp.]MCL6516803.1 MFS transporter [Alicyclobacillus sp.]